MAIEKGSLVLVDYTARVKETGEVVEATSEDRAKELGVYDPSRVYGPRLVAVGEGWVLKGLDEALLSAEVGSSFTVEVPPEKGFGPRNPDNVKLIPLRRFGDKAGSIRVGDEVEVNGRVGVVRFVGSGRVQVDFNPRLAGKTIVYEVRVLKKLEEDREKVVALLKRRLPALEEEKLKLSIRAGEVRIQLPSELYLHEGIQIIKRAVAGDIFKFVRQARKVSFIETYEPPQQRA